MADQTTQNSANPASDPNAKSPLDVLEEILNESKQGGAAGVAPQGAAAADDKPPAAPEEPKPDMAAIKAKIEAAKARDAVEIQQQLTQLQQAYQSPEYLESQRQKQAEAQKKETHEVQTDGFEIEQVQHTKM